MTTREVPDAVCDECGAVFLHRVQLYDDGSVFLDIRICPACMATRAQEIEAQSALTLRANRQRIWNEREMPFADTDPAKLPATRTQQLLDWQYQPTGVIVAGRTGMGKTRSTVLLLHRLWMEEGRDFAFLTWSRWKQSLDAQHRYGGAGVEKFVKPHYRLPLVVLDDMGHGAMPENTLACLFDLLDNRVSRRLPVLITTQFSKAELRAKMEKVSQQTADALIRRLETEFRHIPFDAVKENLLAL